MVAFIGFLIQGFANQYTILLFLAPFCKFGVSHQAKRINIEEGGVG